LTENLSPEVTFAENARLKYFYWEINHMKLLFQEILRQVTHFLACFYDFVIHGIFGVAFGRDSLFAASQEDKKLTSVMNRSSR
jgi:hypothetical protein